MLKLRALSLGLFGRLPDAIPAAAPPADEGEEVAGNPLACFGEVIIRAEKLPGAATEPPFASG